MAVYGVWARFTITLIALIPLFLSGCATTSDFADPRDPWEGFNRGMFTFNDDVDAAFVRPIAKGYKAITPAPIDQGITNFFLNLADFNSAVNNLLQFKLERSANDFGRLAINSTIGILGFIDVASNMNLPKHSEDFGQTLGVWGFQPGPYVVLPFLGPSSVRDAIGLVPDWYMAPIRWIPTSTAVTWGTLGLWFIDRRADLLGASRVLEMAALDPYEFIRDAYLQKREYDVFDGNLPPESFDEFEDEFEDGFEDMTEPDDLESSGTEIPGLLQPSNEP